MRLTEKKVVAALKKHGYKLTPQRRVVIQAITSDREHHTPADIYERVQREHAGVGLVTIYRTLDILAGMGLICEVHAGDGRRSYLMRRPSEHHHHLICSGCGAVVDFTGCDLGELERSLAAKTGFEIESHLLEFLGRCWDCQRQLDEE